MPSVIDIPEKRLPKKLLNKEESIIILNATHSKGICGCLAWDIIKHLNRLIITNPSETFLTDAHWYGIDDVIHIASDVTSAIHLSRQLVATSQDQCTHSSDIARNTRRVANRSVQQSKAQIDLILRQRAQLLVQRNQKCKIA